jgi:ferredoxin-NADP reductase
MCICAAFHAHVPKLFALNTQAQFLLLISGGTGLAPMLQALKSASQGRGGYANIVLVHSARTADDVTLMGNIGAVLAAARVPVNVHFSITQGGVLQPTFVCTQSRGRIDVNLLAQLWVRTMFLDVHRHTYIHGGTVLDFCVHTVSWKN